MKVRFASGVSQRLFGISVLPEWSSDGIAVSPWAQNQIWMPVDLDFDMT